MLRSVHWWIIGAGLLLFAAIKLTFFIKVMSTLKRHGQTAKKSEPGPPR